jgi:hypothetical protein
MDDRSHVTPVAGRRMSVLSPPEEGPSRLVILEADSEAGDSCRTFVFRQSVSVPQQTSHSNTVMEPDPDLVAFSSI